MEKLAEYKCVKCNATWKCSVYVKDPCVFCGSLYYTWINYEKDFAYKSEKS